MLGEAEFRSEIVGSWWRWWGGGVDNFWRGRTFFWASESSSIPPLAVRHVTPAPSTSSTTRRDTRDSWHQTPPVFHPCSCRPSGKGGYPVSNIQIKIMHLIRINTSQSWPNNEEQNGQTFRAQVVTANQNLPGCKPLSTSTVAQPRLKDINPAFITRNLFIGPQRLKRSGSHEPDALGNDGHVLSQAGLRGCHKYKSDCRENRRTRTLCRTVGGLSATRRLRTSGAHMNMAWVARSTESFSAPASIPRADLNHVAQHLADRGTLVVVDGCT